MRYDPKNPFDRFVRLITKYPSLQWFAPVYGRYREFLLYALMGVGTVILSIGTYLLFTERFGWNILTANAVSWVFATLFAFLTNRTWVFTTRKHGKRAFVEQLLSFSFGRFLTLLLEEEILHLFVTVLGFPNVPVKFVSQAVVVVTNYLISKLFVFSTRKGRMHHLLAQSARAVKLRMIEEEEKLKEQLVGINNMNKFIDYYDGED